MWASEYDTVQLTPLDSRLCAAVTSVIGPLPEPHGAYHDDVSVQNRGSELARVQGVDRSQDPQQWRVHVIVQASLDREGEPTR